MICNVLTVSAAIEWKEEVGLGASMLEVYCI